MREEDSCEQQAAHERAIGMLNELAFKGGSHHGIAPIISARKPPEKVRLKIDGAEEIEPSHQANKASPIGECQLARTNVAEAQQKKIRLTTQKKLYTTNQASDPA